MVFKYLIKNEAWAHGKTVTFMPKPLYGENGSGMHTHQSLWQGGNPLFYDEIGHAGLSDVERWYIGGLLAHAPSLLAFTNPTVNSFRRLVPGYEAPVNLVYSQGNRSGVHPHPGDRREPEGQTHRVPGTRPVVQPLPRVLGDAARRSGRHPQPHRAPAPIDKDLYELPPDELATVEQVSASLGAVLDALENDNDYLQVGDVFTPDLLSTWVDYKRRKEIDPVRLRPTPLEFELYFDT